jgi:GLPGLI family protein
MKMVFTFLGSIIFTSAISAQGNYTIRYKTYSIQFDSLKLSGGLDMILAIKDSQSYTYYPEPKRKPEIKYPLGSALIYKSTYLNISKKLIIDPYGYAGEPKTYALIVYDYPDNKWEITKERKVILGDTCIKAIGNVRGNKTIAYFSPKLPAGFGFHLYIGLPGTILETIMVDKGIQTIAVSIDKTSPEIIEPTYAKRVTEEEYWERRKKNPAKKITWD